MTDGAVSGGLGFDGTSSVATADLPKNQALTASLWLRPASFPTDRSHVALNQGNGTQTWTGWGFSVLTDGRIRSFVEGGTGSTELAAGTIEPVCLDRWTHVAVTIGGGEMRLYRDGVYQESAYPTLPIAYSTNGFVLGFHSYYKNYYYDGAMDELAVWDVVLTDAEIAEIALRGLCGQPVVE